jgi:hypothetical protein
MAMSTFDDIFSAAQSLSSAERARLITLLADNLSPDEWPVPSPEWLEEAGRNVSTTLRHLPSEFSVVRVGSRGVRVPFVGSGGAG